MALSIAAVVVLVPSHLRFLSGLLLNLNASEVPFEHVLIVASGFKSKKSVLTTAKLSCSPRVTVVFSPLGSAGRNRNLAWEVISEDIICFLDGDDLYSPRRNGIILELFEESSCDMFLHGFREFSKDEEVALSEQLSKTGPRPKFVWSEDLDIQPNRNRAEELEGRTPSTNLVFRDPAIQFPVQHAHVTVRADVGEVARFHEVFGVRNEDGVFAQDVLESGARVALSPEKLSYYRQGERAKPKMPNLNLPWSQTASQGTSLHLLRPT